MNAVKSIKKLIPQRSKTPRPVKTPTILQMESVECGAAALSIILSYYGRYIPLEKLRVACGVSRDGLKATNLMMAARAYGLKAKGYAKSIEKLKAEKMPAIIFWNFNHFLVLEGFTKKKVYLSDPATGRYSVTHQEFDDAFTGVVICLEPDEHFEKGNEKTGLIKSLSKRISNSKLSLVFIILTSLFLVIPGLIIPSFTQIFIDRYLINNMSGIVMPLLLTMAGVLIINSLLIFVQQYYLLRLETKLALSTSSKFLWHVFHLPITFFSQRSTGDIANRVSLNDKVARLLSGDLANAALNVIVVVFYALLMLSYDLTLTLVGIVIAALNILALQMVSRARKDGNRRLVAENGKLIGNTMNGISMIETLKSSGRESDFFASWAGYLAKMLNVQQDLGYITLKFNAIPPLLQSLSTAIILGLGAMKVMNGDMTIGMLVAFMYLMNNFISPVNQLVSAGAKLQETEGDMNVIDDVENYEVSSEFRLKEEINQINQDINNNENSVDLLNNKLVGKLELKDIKFGYSKVLPALIEDFELTLEPGSRIALVGGSGSGKSTVARLVAGLFEPWEGEILFDGKTRKELPRQIINNSMAIIDQEIMMFEGTVKENISFWDDTMSETNVIRSAQDAMIHDVIAARVGSYESTIAEKGTNYSGGQRQRIEIARALALNPTLLIMDEATSALDPKSEKEVMDNIRKRGCTCLIVAHRLSTIRDCDEIIVMDFGKIAERGTHEELLKKDGLYAQLISSK